MKAGLHLPYKFHVSLPHLISYTHFTNAMVLKMSISRVHDRDVMSDSVNVGARNMKKKNWFYGGFVESQ